MKVTTSGVLRRIDLTPAIDFLPALFQQWNDLQFDHAGRVVDAPIGSAISQLVLVEGRHCQPGARYHVMTDQPVFATLEHHDQRRVVATLSDGRRRWAADVELQRERLPTVDVTLRVDPAARPSTDATPGRIDRFLGGRGEGRATIDLRAIEGKGALVAARGRVNRFRVSGRADVDSGAASWSVDAALSIAGRGLGRVVMLLGGRRLRRHFEGRFEQFWQTAEARIAQVERQLQQLAIAVQREGGETALVHRVLWDPTAHPGHRLSGER